MSHLNQLVGYSVPVSFDLKDTVVRSYRKDPVSKFQFILFHFDFFKKKRERNKTN
jgi:hypothetical protein